MFIKNPFRMEPPSNHHFTDILTLSIKLKINSRGRMRIRPEMDRVRSPQGADLSSPLPLSIAKAGRNHLNEEISPSSPHWDRRSIQPNQIKFRTCSSLAPM